MSGMDTNSIQPITENQTKSVIATDSVSFEAWFCRLPALGVWQISFLGSCILSGVLAFGVGTAFDSNSTMRCLIQSAFMSWCLSVFIWSILSRFKWPTAVRFILAFWSSIVVGLLAIQPMFSNAYFQSPSILAILMSKAFLATFVMPSIVIGLSSLLPFVYRENLEKKNALLSGSSKILLEKSDGREQT